MARMTRAKAEAALERLTNQFAGMDPDDVLRLINIFQTINPRELVAAINEYWRDGDRADRTPRDFLVYHLGVVTQIAAMALDEIGG